ncbi:MAG: class I SAM-dependent methyltransferase [Spiribacter salinus]|uniref:Class I SAM-dependent methyltransferase n=1 Tax=Spiribacter salinus TaxID=1335746 RepID=A0A540VQD2_9GAMM|nr:MAG: class I SAM-dependent methyltransferase [Spiribacter salinus]
MTSGSHDEFYEYYARESLTPAAQRRFRAQRDTLLRLLAPPADTPLNVLDLGCGPGTSTMLWADAGHRPLGVDINEKLLRLAAQRGDEHGKGAQFLIASAHELPLPDGHFDVCVAPELLEHVPDWEGCVREIARVLKPGGIAFLSTTNVLCPKQDEFRLPLFSWYPAALKRHYIRQAQTVRPELANYATYPAVNWFTFYSLRRALRRYGFSEFWSRYDIIPLRTDSRLKSAVARLLGAAAPTRFLAQCASPGTKVFAKKGIA